MSQEEIRSFLLCSYLRDLLIKCVFGLWFGIGCDAFWIWKELTLFDRPSKLAGLGGTTTRKPVT